MIIKRKLHVPTLNAEDPKTCSIELAPFKGETGTLKTSGSMLKEMSKPNVVVYLQPAKAGSGRAQLSQMIIGRIGPKQALPVGAYKVGYGMISNSKMIAMFSSSTAIEIKAGGEAKLQLDKPEISVSVKQKGRRLEVNRSLKGKSGVEFRSFQPVVEEGKKPPQPSNPMVAVYVKGGGTKPVASGKLEYG